MFPQEFINELKHTIKLVDLASEYTQLSKVGGGLYQAKCPHPNHEDKNPSFRVWERGYQGSKFDSWACMVCHSGSKNTSSKEYKNYGTDCIAFYQWMEGVSWKQAVYDLCEKYSIAVPSSIYDKLYKAKTAQTEGYIKNMYSAPYNYLYNRGLSKKDIQDWKIGFEGRKIVFPLMNRFRQPIGFTKRWLEVPEDRSDKYRNSATSKIFNKSSYLYGIHNLDDSFDEIRITEGPMDVIVAHKYGVKNITATLGTAFTEDHVELIKSIGKIPVFVMDGDGPGKQATQKAIQKLADAGVYSKVLILSDNKDLCDLSLELKEDIEEYISLNAVTYGQHKIQGIFASYDSQINEIKMKQYKNIKKVLSEIPFEVERDLIKEDIYNKMGIRM